MVFLIKYIGSKLYYLDIVVMKNGVVEFIVKKDMKLGIFVFFMFGEKYFEFIYNKEDIFIEMKVFDFVFNMKVKKLEENKVFVDYIFFIIKEKNVQQVFICDCDKEVKGLLKIEKIQYLIDSIFIVVINYQNNLISMYSFMLVLKFIKMFMEVNILDYLCDVNGKIMDFIFCYKYYCMYFWDNIDLKDDCLVNSFVFGQKIEFYFGKNMLVQYLDMIFLVVYVLID